MQHAHGRLCSHMSRLHGRLRVHFSTQAPSYRADIVTVRTGQKMAEENVPARQRHFL